MTEMTQAELDEAKKIAGDILRPATCGYPDCGGACLECDEKVRTLARAIIHLAARPQMPALRWDEERGEHVCFMGNILVGVIERIYTDDSEWRVVVIVRGIRKRIGEASRPEARAAVEAAVLKELGAVPVPAIHDPSDLRAVVARLERDRTDLLRMLAEAKATIAQFEADRRESERLVNNLMGP